MNISVFRWWYRRILLVINHLPYKLKFQSEAIRSDCVSTIVNRSKLLLRRIELRIYKAGIKQIQLIRVKIQSGEKTGVCFSPNIAFAQTEVVGIKIRFFLYSILLMLFLLSEVIILSLVASLFVPGGTETMKFSVSLFLALGIMVTISASMKKIEEYKEAHIRFKKGSLTGEELLTFRTARTWGVVFMIVTYVSIGFAGIARICFLEFVPSNGMEQAKYESVQRASFFASAFMLLISFGCAHSTAQLKLELSKVAKRFFVYRYWRRTHKRENRNYQQLIKDAQRLLTMIEAQAQSGWQLIMDLVRVYQPEDECDACFVELNQEFIKVKTKPGFSIDETIYAKFAPVQNCHRELFIYGIFNAKEVAEKIAFAKAVLAKAKEHLATYNRVSSAEMLHVAAKWQTQEAPKQLHMNF
jgi:hypothetical protein